MRKILLALALLLPLPALAAEGGRCATDGYYSGDDFVDICVYLCDRDPTTATETCAEFDVDSERGIPLYGILKLETTTNCSGTPTAQLEGMMQTGTNPATISKVLTPDGWEQQVIRPLTNRYMQIQGTDLTACSLYQVKLILRYAR